MQEIRDASGRVIATIVDASGGVQTVFDARGRNIGYSDMNGTFDARGSLVSTTPGQFGLLIAGVVG